VSAVATRDREAVALERPQRGPRPALFDDGVTLEDKILGVWEDLVVEGRAACPVCGGSMEPATGCSDCGSELSRG
jgi:tRNA(Ile2) C34 agmatinyltransferase TiaS